MKSKLYLVLFIGLLFGCQQEKEPLRLATYTYATNNRIENMRPLAENMESLLNRKVEMQSYPDVESFISAIKANEVDVALINTLGYLVLASDNEHMIPVANMHIREDAVDNYKTVLLTQNDSIVDYSQLMDNAGSLTMMFVAEGSTSGNLVPRLFLSAIGLPSPESQFQEVKYGGNHTSTLEKLLAGEADLCAIGSNEYYKQINADTTLNSRLRALWISDEIPLGPVLINKGVSDDEKERITSFLLALHTQNVNAFESIKAGWSEAKQADKFQPITDEYYDSFREVDGNKTHLENILKMFEEN